MAPKAVPSESWIIFTFSLLLSYHLTDGAPFYTFNGTQSQILFTERNAHLIQTPVDVIYEGNNYKQFYISNDGYITFTTEKAAVRYVAQDWSSTGVSPFVDIPFIAPYYFNAYPLDLKPGYVGLVHYQELTNGSKNGQDLQTLGQYVSRVMVSGKQFSPTWGMVVSWENVTSDSVILQGTCDGTRNNPCPVNTFQLLLLSDGTVSFAIFNYYSMNVPVEKYHQAGFNGGNGIGFYSVLGPSVGVASLLTHQSSDTAGRYVFDITSGVIQRGGCNTAKTDMSLSVFPKYAGMFGGKVIDISGPCFSTSPRCRFTDTNSRTTFNGTVVSVTQAKMRCVVPRMTVRGKVVLSVSVDGGNTYGYQTPFTIVFPGRMSNSEHVTAEATSSNMAWYSTNTTSMTLSWDPALLANTSHVVDITLYGYREASGQSMYTMLTKLGTAINGNRGTYTVDPSKTQCSGQTCFDYEVGLLEVRLQDGVTPQQYKFLSSKAIPLGWYVRTAMTSRHGSNWPSQMCVNWYNRDRQDMSWTNNLLSCPCSLTQALADFGRWQPDNGCNLMNAASPNNCFYHRGAIHCVRAVQPTVGGAGNQCCYNQAYTLVYAADSFQGSTPDKSHDWGAAPYVMPGHVPSLSHWIKDVVTFYYCCLWTEYGSCDYYMDLRPTKDCIAYVPPLLASVFGQGHVMSFGGDTIRILSQGDYNLLIAANTTIQGRFENRTITATDGSSITYSYILSAVSVQDAGTSDTIELRLRPTNFDRSVKYIDVRVNKKLATFNEHSMRWQDFKGVAVVNTDYTRKVQSNFTVILTNGIGFQVAEVAETLQLDVMVPSSLASTRGLFGTLGGNMTRPNGTSIDTSTITLSDVYYTYELPWAVESGQASLFTNHIPANFSSNNPVSLNRTAAPNINLRAVTRLCQSYMPCTFDYRTTGSPDIARSSLNAQQRYMALTNSLQPVRTCGLLNIPRATKDNYNIVLGTQTTLTGCRYGSLSGPTTYTCTATSNQTQAWSPAVTTSCQYPTEEASTVLILAILVPCVVVLFVAIVAVVCVYKQRKKRGKKNIRGGEAQTEEEKVTMKTDV